jgi:hypothetical protein
MTTKEQLARLALQTLKAQQRFFKGTPGSAEKAQALTEAKALERQLREACDEVLEGPRLFT